MTDTTQEHKCVKAEQSKFDEYQGTPTLPSTKHQTIHSANPTQPPQTSTSFDPYYNRGHITYTNNHHECPSNCSVFAINYTVPARPTPPNQSLHQGPDADQRFPLEQSIMISSQPRVSAPFVQQFPTPHSLVGLFSIRHRLLKLLSTP